MRLEYYSRVGRFNFADPSQDSISCHIVVFNELNEKIKSTNIHPEYEIEGDDIDEVIDNLESANERVWYSSAQGEWKEMIEFLKKHRDEIEAGNKEYKITEIKKQIEVLQKQLEQIVKN
jgi:hypothetical protein